MKENTRELWPDLIRIFAIYGVITLHTMSVYPTWISPYFFKIFETSVPLFVMLSGALLLGKTESYLNFFKKRSFKVLIPWIVWTIIYMVFFYLLKDKYILSTYFNSGIIDLNNFARFFFIQFFTGLWFLPLIFGVYLITPPLRLFIKAAKNKDIYYLLFLWFIFLSLLPSITSTSLFPDWLPSFIYAPIQYSGYFILGYILITKLKERNLKMPSWYGIPLFALILILPITNFVEPVTILASVIIFSYLFSLSNILEKRISGRIRDLMIAVSSASLGIYIIHAFITYYLGIYLNMNLTISKFGIIYTIFIFVVSFMVVYLLQRIPILKNIVP